MARQELIEATNQLFRLSGRAERPGASETARVLSLACRALGSTLDDAKMAKSLGTLSRNGNAGVSLADERAHIAELCRTFVRTERELLRAAGLTDGAIRSLMDAGHEMLAACVSAPLDIGQLYVSLYRLERRVCGRAGHIMKTAIDRRQRINVRNTLAQGAVGVGGAVIVAINAGAIPSVPGLQDPMALMSVTFGSALINSSIRAPWDTERRLT